MNEETIEELHARLAALEDEIVYLRLDCLVTSRRYAKAQVSLKELTALSLTAATRAAIAVHAAEHEPEKNALAAAATTANEAAAEGKRTIESALQAVKIAKAVAEFMNPSNRFNSGQQPSVS